MVLRTDTMVEHVQEVVGSMDTKADGMNHMVPEVDRMDHIAPEVLCRRSTILGDAAKNRRWSDGVSEINHLREVFETRRTARDP